MEFTDIHNYISSTVPIGVIICDRFGIIKMVNQTCAELLGYTENELTESAIESLVPKNLIKNHIQYRKTFMDTPLPTIMGKGRRTIAIHKDGREIQVEVTLNPVIIDNMQSVICTVVDVLKRKEIISEIAFNSELIGLLTEGIAMTSMNDGNIIFCNRSFEKMFGYDFGEMNGMPIGRINAPTGQDPIKVNKIITQEVEKNGFWEGEVKCIKKDGGLIWTYANITFHRHPIHGNVIIGIQRDISKRKQMEMDLQLSKEQSEKAQIIKTQFLTSMSHEIRTPLGAIHGFTHMMLKKTKNNHPTKIELQEYLNRINLACINLTNIVNNVLDLSKIEAGKIRPNKRFESLNELFKNISALYGPIITGKGLSFKYDIDKSVPSKVCIDPLLLNQVLVNLIGNSIKHTIKGGIELNACLTNGDLRVIVKDTGPGIPQKKINKIFESFEQVESQQNLNSHGTGLGLSICRSFISILDGNIKVESKERKGTKFIIDLPLHSIGAKFDSLQVNHEIQNYKIFGSNHKILVIEDEILNIELFKLFLEDLNLEYEVATNAKDGIKMALEFRPDIIFMDMHLPEMSGLDTCKIIRDSPEMKDVPCILITADIFHDERTSCFNDVFTKPINFNLLQTILSKYLN